MGYRIAAPLVLVILVALPACSSEDGEPLVSGALTVDWNGESTTAVNGFATLYNDAPVIGIGDGPIHCGTENSPTPPDGTNVVIYPPDYAVGDYTSVYVQIHRNIGNYEAVGSNQGTLSITASSDGSIAGTLGYDYTDMTARHFAASGTFEVLHCTP